jgi:hypothetical protein
VAHPSGVAHRVNHSLALSSVLFCGGQLNAALRTLVLDQHADLLGHLRRYLDLMNTLGMFGSLPQNLLLRLGAHDMGARKPDITTV